MNSYLFCSYNIISLLFKQFGLVIEHEKSKVFHFSRLHGLFNLPPLDLSLCRGSVLKHKDTQRYLEFIFNKKLSFQQHIKFYSNKALLIVKCMKMLGNFTQGLLPHQNVFSIECVYSTLHSTASLCSTMLGMVCT